jgi:hypothetical protein
MRSYSGGRNNDNRCEPHVTVPDTRITQLRDIVEAKYRAGLCAGMGIEDDWRDWFFDRVRSWKLTDVRHRTWLRMVRGDDFSRWASLPAYWTSLPA